MYKVPMCKPASAANLFANHWTKRFVLFGNQNWKDLAKTELCRETFILDQVTQFSVEFSCIVIKRSRCQCYTISLLLSASLALAATSGDSFAG